LHPEVTDEGLLTLLYAGTTSIYSSKYSIYNDTVKKLEQRSQSAGNILNIKNGTSETLRNGIIILENVKRVSDHVPIHMKPLNNEQLGHYIAGLIDGDSYFKDQQLVLFFSSSDAFLAYCLKEQLGYGNVKKLKDKTAYLLIISNKEGMLNVLNLINGKLRRRDIFNQVISDRLNDSRYMNIEFTMNSSNNFDNHWLAGFSDAKASFQIKTIKRINSCKREVILNYEIDHKNALLLTMIKDYLGGNIAYRKEQDTYYYDSTSFGSAKKLILYFNKYHLQSRKHISYLRWRKVYMLIQNKERLTEKGLVKLLKIKSLINRYEKKYNLRYSPNKNLKVFEY